MSICFDVREKLCISKVDDSMLCHVLVETMKIKLASLFSGVMTGNILVRNAKVAIDEVTNELHPTLSIDDIASVLSNVINVKSSLLIDLEYSCSRMDDLILEQIGNIFLENSYARENIESDLYYEYYLDSDAQEDGCGSHYVFGTKGGKTYSGEIKFNALNSFPEGEWYSVHEFSYVDVETDKYVNKPEYGQMIKLFDSVKDLGDDYSSIDDKYINLSLFNVSLASEDDINRLADVIGKLRNWFGYQGEYSLYFVDQHLDFVRRMQIDIDLNGEYKIKLAEK